MMSLHVQFVWSLKFVKFFDFVELMGYRKCINGGYWTSIQIGEDFLYKTSWNTKHTVYAIEPRKSDENVVNVCLHTITKTTHKMSLDSSPCIWRNSSNSLIWGSLQTIIRRWLLQEDDEEATLDSIEAEGISLPTKVALVDLFTKLNVTVFFFPNKT